MKLNLKVYDDNLNIFELGMLNLTVVILLVFVFLFFCIVSAKIIDDLKIKLSLMIMLALVFTVYPIILTKNVYMLAEYSTPIYKVVGIDDKKLVLKSENKKVIQKIEKEDDNSILLELKVGDKFKLETGKEVIKKRDYKNYDDISLDSQLDLKLVKL